MKKTLIAVGVVLSVLLAGPAVATDEPDYVLALWEAPGGPEDHFALPQILVASVETNDTSLNALDAPVECGTTYQVDLYANDEITASLIAGGTLVAPGNPRESWPGGHYRSEFSKVFTTDDCVVVPPLVEPPVVVPPATPAAPVVNLPKFTG